MSIRSKMTYDADRSINSQRRFGESKHEAKQLARQNARESGEHQTVKGVFSYSTEHTYKKNGRAFINWVRNKHPETKTLEQAKKHVAEYLHDNISRGLSAHTVHTRAFALACIFRCDVKEFGVDLPTRKSSEIKRTRSAPNIEEFRRDTQYIHRFAAATGARRIELKRLKEGCLKVDNQGKLRILLDGKGGKTRWARVLEHERDFVISVVESAQKGNLMRADGCKRIFPDRIIPEKEPLHQHRKEYAKALYDEVIENREHEILDRGLYHCRGERYGKVFNRTALAIVSYHLGHGQPDDLPHEVERISVVVLHYLW